MLSSHFASAAAGMLEAAGLIALALGGAIFVGLWGAVRLIRKMKAAADPWRGR